MERKRLELLEQLKALNGPFTNSDHVKSYLNDSKIIQDLKKKRMKMEVQFARSSSTTLPKGSQIFRIMVTNSQTKKRRDKTLEEFGESLMCYLGKTVHRKPVDYELFFKSLCN